MISKIKRNIQRKYKNWNRAKNPWLALNEIPIKGNDIKIDAPFRINNPSGVQLGSDVHISSHCNFQADGGICIQDNVVLEKNVTLLSHSSSKAYQPIIIGANSRIGTNSTIFPGVTIAKGSIIPPKSLITSNFGSNKEEYTRSSDTGLYSNPTIPNSLIFVVSTGRSGSKAIASFFEQHSQVHAIHDSYLQFGRYAIDKLYGRLQSDQLKQTLLDTFVGLSYIEKPNHVQSDQKLGALICELAEIFPSAKFIWLIRNLEDFTNSAYPRGWFDNSEFGYCPNPKEFKKPQHKPAKYYAAYRVNGFRTGSFSEEQWRTMTAFERNCWYWKYWNNLIQSQLKHLDPSRYMQLYLKDLQEKSEELQVFSGLQVEPLVAKRVNKAFYKKVESNSWTDEMTNIYRKYISNYDI